MRRLVTRLVGEFQAEREMRQFIDRLTGELRAGGRELTIPTDPDELLAALIEVISEIRGRKVVLLKEEFPHRTATGLWLDLPDEDLVLVDQRATALHQLAILFHEIWHMIKGDCGHHIAGATVAARMLDERTDLRHLQPTVLRVAARSVFDEQVEQDAETFALKAVTHFRVWLEGKPENTDRAQIAGRIGASLGSRRPQV